MKLNKNIKELLVINLMLSLMILSVIIVGGLSYILSYPFVKIMNVQRGTDVPRLIIPLSFAIKTAQYRFILMHKQ
jgi:hypothetical protein